jgi:hypothetical protein
MAYPGRDLERSTLWRANQLTADEKAALESEWWREFTTAQAVDFSINDGSSEILVGDCARAAHYAWADIPRELVKRWLAVERRRRARAKVAVRNGRPIVDSVEEISDPRMAPVEEAAATK